MDGWPPQRVPQSPTAVGRIEGVPEVGRGQNTAPVCGCRAGNYRGVAAIDFRGVPLSFLSGAGPCGRKAPQPQKEAMVSN